MSKLDIHSVAIIGAGPGGIASIYELTHTNSDGTSTVGGAKAPNPQFTNIVAFEQKERAGGIWAPSLNKADLPVPPQDILDSGKYNDPDVLHPPQTPPEGINRASYDKPIVTEGSNACHELEWRRSGVFEDLFTNIPSSYVRFSYLPNEKKYLDKSRKIYPFLSQQELVKRVDDFIERESLKDYIRFNSRVEKVTKNSNGKWVLTIKEKRETDSEERWYQQEFDAVIISNGHYTVPNIPYIPGLAEFNKKYPGSIIHAKSYRSADEFKDKKTLIIGFGVSTANLVQYIVPVAKETIVAQRGPSLVFDWINEGLISKGITRRPEVERIDSEKNEVHFKDGTKETNIDKILFTTGYHFHYPFLNDYLKVVSPSNISRVGGLYYNTFSFEDPTLAAVGVTVAHLNFHTIEASAAAIAGIWSGAKSLPSKDEQRDWEQKRIAEIGDNLLFHYYIPEKVKPDFVDPLYPLFAENRYNPLESDIKLLDDINIGVKSLEKLFYQLKDGGLSVQDTVYSVEA